MEVGAGAIISLPARAGARAVATAMCSLLVVRPMAATAKTRTPLTALLSSSVVIKPSPDNIQEELPRFSERLGMDPTIRIRFVEDNWKRKPLGAQGTRRRRCG